MRELELTQDMMSKSRPFSLLDQREVVPGEEWKIEADCDNLDIAQSYILLCRLSLETKEWGGRES